MAPDMEGRKSQSTARAVINIRDRHDAEHRNTYNQLQHKSSYYDTQLY
jgi:hypothetical protein